MALLTNFPLMALALISYNGLIFGLGGGVGWALAIITFAAIRERLKYSDVPKGLQGLGIAFVITGLMSLSFTAFAIGGTP